MCPVMSIFIHFLLNNSKLQCKKIFEIKFAYVTNDNPETSIKNHIYHYTTPCEMVICDSDDMAGDHILHE
jgi:hypothetical protein